MDLIFCYHGGALLGVVIFIYMVQQFINVPLISTSIRGDLIIHYMEEDYDYTRALTFVHTC